MEVELIFIVALMEQGSAVADKPARRAPSPRQSAKFKNGQGPQLLPFRGIRHPFSKT